MPQYNSEKDYIKGIFQQNVDKDFVYRALYPEQSPKLNDNPDGRSSTHSMAWGTGEDGKAYVYPSVVRGPDGNLVRLSTPQRPTNNMDAGDYAFKTGEFIEVDSAAKADWLAKRYKKIWEQ